MPRHKEPPAPEPLPPEFARLTTLALPLATAQDELEAMLDSPDYVPAFIRDEMEAEQLAQASPQQGNPEAPAGDTGAQR